MASNIDPSKPTEGNATTSSVRDNFTAAKTEIEQLQNDLPIVQNNANAISIDGHNVFMDTPTDKFVLTVIGSGATATIAPRVSQGGGTPPAQRTWKNRTRVAGTTYTNTSSQEMIFSICAVCNAINLKITAYVNDVLICETAESVALGEQLGTIQVTVPPNQTYKYMLVTGNILSYNCKEYTDVP
jgi:hypothetical protein